jgi:hypothetical protein
VELPLTVLLPMVLLPMVLLEQLLALNRARNRAWPSVTAEAAWTAG